MPTFNDNCYFEFPLLQAMTQQLTYHCHAFTQ